MRIRKKKKQKKEVPVSQLTDQVKYAYRVLQGILEIRMTPQNAHANSKYACGSRRTSVDEEI